MIYSIFITFIFLLAIINLTLNFKQKKISVFLTFLGLFLFAALRGSGNGDYYTYLNYSKLITDFDSVLDNDFPMEIGFRILSYFVNFISANSQWVIILMNFISLTLFYKFISKYSSNMLLSVFLFLPYYFMFDMHAARTAVAIAITTLSIKYILKRNFFKFIIIIILATCFHLVAIVMLPVYFLVNYKIFNYYNILIILLMIPFSYFFNLLNLVILLASKIGIGNIASKVVNYAESDRFGYAFSLLDPRFLLLLVFFTFAVILFKNLDNQTSLTKLWGIMIWVAMILTLIVRSNTFITYRTTSFYSLYLIVLIPEILIEIKSRFEKKVFIMFYIFILLLFLVYTLFLIKDYPAYIFFFSNLVY